MVYEVFELSDISGEPVTQQDLLGVIDERGIGASNFWGRVANFDGETIVWIDNYPLNPSGRTQLNITTPLPVFEVKDLTVTAWADATGTRECIGDECRPLEGDPVVTLRERNWPYVYQIVFTRQP